MKDIFKIIGHSGIEEFITRFYDKVETDDILRPLYRDNLEIPRRHLLIYLVQVFGGPADYRKERGKPKLKFRHVPFAIGKKERDRWMELMTQSLHESEVHNHPDIEQDINEFLGRLATRMINNSARAMMVVASVKQEVSMYNFTQVSISLTQRFTIEASS